MRIITSANAALYLPVTVDDFCNAVHVDPDEDQDALQDLIGAAVEVVERAVRRSIGRREMEFVAPAGSWSRWWFPVAPVAEILAVAQEDHDGEWWEVAPEHYRLTHAHDEPQLVILSPALSGRPFRIRATVGFETRAETLTMRRAAILQAKQWRDADIALEGIEARHVSFGVERLIKQHRYQRPKETA